MTSRLHSFIMAKVSHAINHSVMEAGVALLTLGRSYIGNDVTLTTLLDRACTKIFCPSSMPK